MVDEFWVWRKVPRSFWKSFDELEWATTNESWNILLTLLYRRHFPWKISPLNYFCIKGLPQWDGLHNEMNSRPINIRNPLHPIPKHCKIVLKAFDIVSNCNYQSMLKKSVCIACLVLGYINQRCIIKPQPPPIYTCLHKWFEKNWASCSSWKMRFIFLSSPVSYPRCVVSG